MSWLTDGLDVVSNLFGGGGGATSPVAAAAGGGGGGGGSFWGDVAKVALPAAITSIGGYLNSQGTTEDALANRQFTAAEKDKDRALQEKLLMMQLAAKGGGGGGGGGGNAAAMAAVRQRAIENMTNARLQGGQLVDNSLGRMLEAVQRGLAQAGRGV